MTLADLDGLSTAQLRDHLVSTYAAGRDEVEAFDVVVAFEEASAGAAYWLLERGGQWFEARGVGQFRPARVSAEHLRAG